MQIYYQVVFRSIAIQLFEKLTYGKVLIGRMDYIVVICPSASVCCIGTFYRRCDRIKIKSIKSIFFLQFYQSACKIIEKVAVGASSFVALPRISVPMPIIIAFIVLCARRPNAVFFATFVIYGGKCGNLISKVRHDLNISLVTFLYNIFKPLRRLLQGIS